MHTFIIGDIHGCFYSLEKMLAHWEPKEQMLLLVDDYIDRGNFSGKVLKLLWEIKKSNSHVVLLKGNHEYIYKFHYTNVEQIDWATIGAGKATILDFQREGISIDEAIVFFDSLQLDFENKNFRVSHAGIAHTDSDVFAEDNYEFGILWNWKPLLNLGKPQIIGHTPHELKIPLFNEKSNSFNIDSGCCYGRGLLGIVVNEKGEFEEMFFEQVDLRDIT
jgi:serine/threonine protein phosphatase 1